MMRRLIVFAILCNLLLLVSTQPNDRNCRNDHRPNKDRKRKTRDELSIQRCKNIKCENGRFCYNGICKKVDYGCIGKKCEKGFRCNKGQCVKQKHEAKKQFCEPLGFNQKKLRCGEQQKLRCFQNQQRPNICGYSWTGVFEDFINECSACLAHKFKFYYEGPCSSSPKVCSREQQCLNGACSMIFNEDVFENNRICNQNVDCKPNEYCAGHKCVKKGQLLAYLKIAAEAAPIQQTI